MIKENSLKAIQNGKEPIKVTWKNLEYTVNVPTTKLDQEISNQKTKKLTVLKNCTGYALPG